VSQISQRGGNGLGMPLQRGPVIGAEFEDGDPHAATPVLMADILVRRDQNADSNDSCRWLRGPAHIWRGLPELVL
jgi:hypothetical protein